MEFERGGSARSATRVADAEPSQRRPLVLLRDTERSLRRTTVDALVPILPKIFAITLGETSLVADESLDQLAAIDLDKIDDLELKPFRIKMGLLFVGVGALAMGFLLLYLNTLHPELSAIGQVRQYWYQYIWFVSLGIAGMFMLGREAMRPPTALDELDESEW